MTPQMTQPTTGLRPRLHLTPPGGWINDPHGLFHMDGRYHLFFQYVPDALEHRVGCHWGHVTSTDLLHWEHEPIALSPGDGDVGIWSGCAVVKDDGQPLLFYTAANHGDLGRASVRVARPADQELRTWAKGEIVAVPQRDDTVVFRDPVITRDGDGWRMLVGHGDAAEVAGAEVFRSADLETWEYDGLLTTRPGTAEPWTGAAWECPQLVRRTHGLDADVLVVSVWATDPFHVSATAGIYADGTFTQGDWQQLTAGRGHYAPSHFTDVDGRPCLFFWIRGIVDPGNWTGAISVPYVVGDEDGRIVLTPHPALAAARTAPGGEQPGTALDIEWAPGAAGRLRLVGADGRDRAELEARAGTITVTVAGDAEPVVVTHTAPGLRVVVDAQVLEVVADGGLVGLPLSDVEGGLRPQADAPESLTWWHLT